MKTQTITTKTINRVRTLIRTNTYAQAATILKKEKFKTPRGNTPNRAFVNYVVSTYIH